MFLKKADTRMRVSWVLLIEQAPVNCAQGSNSYVSGIPMGSLMAIKVLINGPRNYAEGDIMSKGSKNIISHKNCRKLNAI